MVRRPLLGVTGEKTKAELSRRALDIVPSVIDPEFIMGMLPLIPAKAPQAVVEDTRPP
jgi:hypothetical protein